MVKIANVRKQIIEFTGRKPPKDQSYKKYLAKCSRLYELDNELSTLANEEPEDDDEVADIQQRIKEIGEEVNSLVHK